MPSGRQHDMITVATGVALTPVVFYTGLSLGLTPHDSMGAAAAWGGAHLAGGMLLSPDLDNETIALKRWGVLGFIWAPYRRLIPHRSWVSHGLIIGGLIRVVYLLACLGLPILLYGLYDPPGAELFSVNLGRLFLYFSVTKYHIAMSLLLGIVTGSDAHVLADKVLRPGTTLRRMINKL